MTNGALSRGVLLAPDDQLPHDLDAETAVLGSLLIAPRAVERIAPSLRPEDFYREAHRKIYRAALELHEHFRPTDLVLLSAELDKRGQLEECGGAAYLTSLISSVPTAVNVEHYARLVQQSGKRRRLIAASGRIANAAYEYGDADSAVSEAERILAEMAHAPDKRSRFRLLKVKDLRQLQPPEPLVDGVLFMNTLVALAGEDGTFKTFTAQDICLSCEAGIPWNGHATAQGGFVYVAAEGSAGLRQREEAWEQAHEREAGPGCHWIADAPQMLNDADVDDLIATIKTITPAPVQVWLDTLSRCLVGGDENNGKDMSRFIASADRIKREIGCMVGIVHHFSRAGNIRGFSGLPAALDTEIHAKVEQAGGLDILTLSCDKQKDAAKFAPMLFTPRVVFLEDGRSSVVLDPTSAVDGTSAAEDELLSILTGTFGQEGATDSQWKSVATAAKVSERSYYRGKKGLVEKALVAPDSDKRGARYRLTAEGQSRCQGASKVPTLP